MRLIDLTGQRFGKLLVESRAANDSRGRSKWLCRCDCGVVREFASDGLRNAGTYSCGCANADATRAALTTHGCAVGKGTPTYNVWLGMWKRCTNRNAHNYRFYGGRGIRVCERWRDFAAFLSDMGERPSGLADLAGGDERAREKGLGLPTLGPLFEVDYRRQFVGIGHPDAAFIATARSLVPRLLAAHRAHVERIAELTAENERLDGMLDDEIENRDARLEQIDAIADALGDEGEWTNLHDRGDAAHELAVSAVAEVESLRDETTRLTTRIAALEAALVEACDLVSSSLYSGGRLKEDNDSLWRRDRLSALRAVASKKEMP